MARLLHHVATILAGRGAHLLGSYALSSVARSFIAIPQAIAKVGRGRAGAPRE